MSQKESKNPLKGWLPESSFAMAKKAKNSHSAQNLIGDPAPTTQPKAQNPIPENFTSLKEIETFMAGCTRCDLCLQRTQIVFGEGSLSAELMFVGEAPGQAEDTQGRPFVGPSGQLLDKMIEAMGKKRADVYLTNVVKCRPPENRKPHSTESETCNAFLRAQIRALKPKVIVALGATAVEAILGTREELSKMRGKPFSFEGATVIPTFHPAYLLRTPAAKKVAWEDLKIAIKILGSR